MAVFARKSGAAVTTSQSWYPSSTAWLSMTAEDAQHQHDPNDPDVAAEAERRAREAQYADPSQWLVAKDGGGDGVCALSGEAFEVIWDDPHGRWAYQGAKRLEGEEAVTWGVTEGAVVKVSCLTSGTRALDLKHSPAPDLPALGGGAARAAAAAAREEEDEEEEEDAKVEAEAEVGGEEGEEGVAGPGAYVGFDELSAEEGEEGEDDA